jgi:imidazolonepropionase-like amidohydrolase
MSILLRGATLIDGTGSDPFLNAIVAVDEGEIRAVGTYKASRDDQTIDLSGLTLLPGLIDAHAHLGIVNVKALADLGTLPVAELACLIFENCRLALEAGFTTIRDLGGLDGGIVQTINKGLISGPRILPSGPALAQTGGHLTLMPAYSDHYRPLAFPGLFQGVLICDGIEGMRLAARTAFLRGATQLKLAAGGGVVSLSDQLEDTQFSVEEIRIAIEEARARRTYVTLHAHGLATIINGLEAGAKCFEHGTQLTEQVAHRMRTAGAVMSPTLTVLHLLAETADAWQAPEEAVERVKGVEAAMSEAVRIAEAEGVKMGLGSDLLGPGQNRRGLEIALRAAIQNPMASIMAATSVNAEIVGLADRVGSIMPGKTADLIAVNGNPLVEPDLFDDPERIVFVMKAGVVAKDSRTA